FSCFFSSRRRHTRFSRDWSSDVCSSDLPLLVLIALWFLWFIGDGLERAWGPFRLTLYFLVGMIGTTIAALLSGSQFSNQMLFTTLFFAFAHFYPEEIIYVFFILPLKIKWIAWVYAGLLLLGFATQTNA